MSKVQQGLEGDYCESSGCMNRVILEDRGICPECRAQIEEEMEGDDEGDDSPQAS